MCRLIGRKLGDATAEGEGAFVWSRFPWCAALSIALRRNNSIARWLSVISSATDAAALTLSHGSCWRNSSVGHYKEKISWMSAAGLGSLGLNSLAPGQPALHW